eukprot:jgi/Bigna1/70174/fgenesh1_pg.11_\
MGDAKWHINEIILGVLYVRKFCKEDAGRPYVTPILKEIKPGNCNVRKALEIIKEEQGSIDDLVKKYEHLIDNDKVSRLKNSIKASGGSTPASGGSTPAIGGSTLAIGGSTPANEGSTNVDLFMRLKVLNKPGEEDRIKKIVNSQGYRLEERGSGTSVYDFIFRNTGTDKIKSLFTRTEDALSKRDSDAEVIGLLFDRKEYFPPSNPPSPTRRKLTIIINANIPDYSDYYKNMIKEFMPGNCEIAYYGPLGKLQPESEKAIGITYKVPFKDANFNDLYKKVTEYLRNLQEVRDVKASLSGFIRGSLTLVIALDYKASKKDLEDLKKELENFDLGDKEYGKPVLKIMDAVTIAKTPIKIQIQGEGLHDYIFALKALANPMEVLPKELKISQIEVRVLREGKEVDQSYLEEEIYKKQNRDLSRPDETTRESTSKLHGSPSPTKSKSEVVTPNTRKRKSRFKKETPSKMTCRDDYKTFEGRTKMMEDLIKEANLIHSGGDRTGRTTTAELEGKLKEQEDIPIKITIIANAGLGKSYILNDILMEGLSKDNNDGPMPSRDGNSVTQQITVVEHGKNFQLHREVDGKREKLFPIANSQKTLSGPEASREIRRTIEGYKSSDSKHHNSSRSSVGARFVITGPFPVLAEGGNLCFPGFKISLIDGPGYNDAEQVQRSQFSREVQTVHVVLFMGASQSFRQPFTKDMAQLLKVLDIKGYEKRPFVIHIWNHSKQKARSFKGPKDLHPDTHKTWEETQKERLIQAFEGMIGETKPGDETPIIKEKNPFKFKSLSPLESQTVLRKMRDESGATMFYSAEERAEHPSIESITMKLKKILTSTVCPELKKRTQYPMLNLSRQLCAYYKRRVSYLLKKRKNGKFKKFPQLSRDLTIKLRFNIRKDFEGVCSNLFLAISDNLNDYLIRETKPQPKESENLDTENDTGSVFTYRDGEIEEINENVEEIFTHFREENSNKSEALKALKDVLLDELAYTSTKGKELLHEGLEEVMKQKIESACQHWCNQVRDDPSVDAEMGNDFTEVMQSTLELVLERYLKSGNVLPNLNGFVEAIREVLRKKKSVPNFKKILKEELQNRLSKSTGVNPRKMLDKMSDELMDLAKELHSDFFEPPKVRITKETQKWFADQRKRFVDAMSWINPSEQLQTDPGIKWDGKIGSKIHVRLNESGRGVNPVEGKPVRKVQSQTKLLEELKNKVLRGEKGDGEDKQRSHLYSVGEILFPSLACADKGGSKKKIFEDIFKNLQNELFSDSDDAPKKYSSNIWALLLVLEAFEMAAHTGHEKANNIRKLMLKGKELWPEASWSEEHIKKARDYLGRKWTSSFQKSEIETDIRLINDESKLDGFDILLSVENGDAGSGTQPDEKRRVVLSMSKKSSATATSAPRKHLVVITIIKRKILCNVLLEGNYSQSDREILKKLPPCESDEIEEEQTKRVYQWRSTFGCGEEEVTIFVVVPHRTDISSWKRLYESCIDKYEPKHCRRKMYWVRLPKAQSSWAHGTAHSKIVARALGYNFCFIIDDNIKRVSYMEESGKWSFTSLQFLLHLMQEVMNTILANFRFDDNVFEDFENAIILDKLEQYKQECSNQKRLKSYRESRELTNLVTECLQKYFVENQSFTPCTVDGFKGCLMETAIDCSENLKNALRDIPEAFYDAIARLIKNESSNSVDSLGVKLAAKSRSENKSRFYHEDRFRVQVNLVNLEATRSLHHLPTEALLYREGESSFTTSPGDYLLEKELGEMKMEDYRVARLIDWGAVSNDGKSFSLEEDSQKIMLHHMILDRHINPELWYTKNILPFHGIKGYQLHCVRIDSHMLKRGVRGKTSSTKAKDKKTAVNEEDDIKRDDHHDIIDLTTSDDMMDDSSESMEIDT